MIDGDLSQRCQHLFGTKSVAKGGQRRFDAQEQVWHHSDKSHQRGLDPMDATLYPADSADKAGGVWPNQICGIPETFRLLIRGNGQLYLSERTGQSGSQEVGQQAECCLPTSAIIPSDSNAFWVFTAVSSMSAEVAATLWM
jgi:hypothetical protein